jgi:hypothetical protein
VGLRRAPDPSSFDQDQAFLQRTRDNAAAAQTRCSKDLPTARFEVVQMALLRGNQGNWLLQINSSDHLRAAPAIEADGGAG